MTNPKDATGAFKVPFSTIPGTVLGELAIALAEGALKYGRHNYRHVGPRASAYYDAALRHLVAWWEGQDLDPDSGLSHITKAIATLVVLRDGMIHGEQEVGAWLDDRPPLAAAPDWLARLNERMAALRAAYPGSTPRAATAEKERGGQGQPPRGRKEPTSPL